MPENPVRKVQPLLIRIEEVATLLGVSERTIWRRCEREKICRAGLGRQLHPVASQRCRSDFINGLKN